MLEFLRKFHRSDEGVAATEFALVVPILIALLFAVIEYSKFNLVDRRADFSAHMLAEYLSRDADNFLARSERHQAQDIWMMVNPTADGADEFNRGGWQRGYSFGWASVEFNPEDPACAAVGCDFEPEVEWVFHLPFGTQKQVKTSCELEIVPNSVRQDGTNIPEGMVGRAALVLVDIVYPYEPLLVSGFLPAQEKHVNAIRKTRSAMHLRHFTQGANYMTWCP